MGRSTSGVTGMKFRDDDDLLAMDVVRDDAYLFTVTEGGIAKRTQLTTDNYRVQGRGGLGIRVANLPERNGDLVGALVVDEGDEVLVIMERGKIVRSAVAGVHPTGRTSQGVIFAKPDKNDRIIGVARNEEASADQDALAGGEDGEAGEDSVDTSSASVTERDDASDDGQTVPTAASDDEAGNEEDAQ